MLIRDTEALRLGGVGGQVKRGSSCRGTVKMIELVVIRFNNEIADHKVGSPLRSQ